MILMNGAYVPYYFNNEKIVSVHQEIRDTDYHVLHVTMENGHTIPVASSMEILKRNWKEIIDWSNYRFGRPELDAVRTFGSGFDDSSDEEMPNNTTIYPELVSDDGEENASDSEGMG